MPNNSRNSMPSFAQGSYENILRLINDGGVNAPAFIYFSDKECLGFLDTKNVLHTILWDRVINIEKQLEDLKDPETGEPISVVEYVKPTVDAIEQIRQNGAAILLTSSDGGDN